MIIEIAKTYGRKTYPNRNGYEFDMIVNHITDGSFDGAVRWLSEGDNEVSSHFVVSRTGRVVQIVETKDGAWANGGVDRPTSRIVKERAGINPNLFTVSIEHEGIFSQTGGELTEAQYQATLELHKWIIESHNALYGKDFKIDRDHIIGHYEISSINKVNCPGSKFPWERLIKDLLLWKNPPVVKSSLQDAPYGKIYALRTGSLKIGANALKLQEAAKEAGFKDAYIELVDFSKEK